jgi:uncharacterized metal-binding protein
MASGNTHDLSVIGASIAVSFVNPIAGASCLVGGLLLSPDIDCKSSPVRRLKAFPPLYWFWSPWQRFKHRCIWTHLPILCTVLKLAWVLLWVSIVGIATGHGLAWVLRPEWLDVARGWAIADTLHWLLDGCPVEV